MSSATASSGPDAGSKNARDMAWETKEAAQGRAQELSERAKAEAAGMADKGKSMAYAKADEAKERGASEIENTAEHIRNAGREFGEGTYADQAADYLASSLSDAASAIRTKDVDGMIADVSDFARRNPAAFLGGAAILGFAAARMLKASERARQDDGYGYRASPGRPDPYGYDAPSAGIGNTPYGARTTMPTTAPTTAPATASATAPSAAPVSPVTPTSTRSNGGLS